MHALGPGLVLYEVQQSSDITYRVYDWDRPASAGRQLHIEQAVAVTDPQRQRLRTSPAVSSAAASTWRSAARTSCSTCSTWRHSRDRGHRVATFHALTVKSGAVRSRAAARQCG